MCREGVLARLNRLLYYNDCPVTDSFCKGFIVGPNGRNIGLLIGNNVFINSVAATTLRFFYKVCREIVRYNVVIASAPENISGNSCKVFSDMVGDWGGLVTS